MKVRMKDGRIGEVKLKWDLSVAGAMPKSTGSEIIPLEVSERIFNGPDCYPWREVFAWTPVKTIGGRYVWFKKVYKQRCWVVWGKGFHMEPHVEYATAFDILSL